MITTENELGGPLVEALTKEGYTEERLVKIFEQRKIYSAHVYAGQESPPDEAFAVFVRGWLKLPKALRAYMECDYARGYPEAVQAAAEAMQNNAPPVGK